MMAHQFKTLESSLGFTSEQRMRTVRIYYQNNGSVYAMQFALHLVFNRHNRPLAELVI